MAKQIKVIKCPHCGSQDKTVVKEDFFKCNSCGTEYFLDNDNINITHTYKYDYENTPKPTVNKKPLLYIFGGIFILFLVISIINTKKTTSPNNTNNTKSTTSSQEENKYTWFNSSQYLYLDLEGKPMILLIGEKWQNGINAKSNEPKITIEIINPLTNKIISSNTIASNKISSIELKEFDNNDIYVIVNKSKLYKFDKIQRTLVLIDSELFSQQPLLQSGTAKIEFIFSEHGSGFNILTNEGKQVYFYPIINKIYINNDFRNAQIGFNSIPANTPEKISFSITRESFDYPEEKTQLLKVKHKNPDGYPRLSLDFRWVKDYGKSGFINSKDPYKKSLISNSSKNFSRITSFTDFTPDRLYFNLRIIDESSPTTLLIGFKGSPAQDAPYVLQALDKNNATIIWTLNFDYSILIDNTIEYDGNYILLNNSQIIIIDNKGKINKQFKLNK